MKLMFGIALVLSFLMLADGVALIAPVFAFAVWLAMPLCDWLFLKQDAAEEFPSAGWR
jgi:hypothetical protein